MSQWTVVTVSSNLSEERLSERLESEYGREMKPPRVIPNTAAVEVRREKDHYRAANEVAGIIPQLELIGVISVSDTSEAGWGHLYEVCGEEVREISYEEGQEGNFGRDVARHFQEKYGIECRASNEG